MADIVGTEGDDHLVALPGDDMIDGGAGDHDVAAFHLPADTIGTLRVVPDGDGYLVQLVQEDESFENLFLVLVTGTGSATVTGLGSMAGHGTDSVTNVEDLHFFADTYPDPVPGGLFVNILLAPRQDGEFVAGSEGGDSIDLADYPGAVNAHGNGGDDTILGNDEGNFIEGGAGDDHIRGEGGNDTLDGGEGQDSLEGGDGDDVYILGEGDGMTELADEGTDEVQTSNDWGLTDNVENLTATGSGNLFLGGNDLDNRIIGNEGDNHIVGHGGNDEIDGGAGNHDVAAFHLPGDTVGTLRVVEDGEGAFLVQLVQEGGGSEDLFFVQVYGPGSATVTGLNAMAWLGTDNVTNVEDLHFFVDVYPEPTPEGQFVNILLTPQQYDEFVAGSGGGDFINLADYPGSLNVDGNAGDDQIFGTDDANGISGGSGDDRLTGRGGSDMVDGGDGDDIAAYELPGDTTGTLRVVADGDNFLVQLVQEEGGVEDLFLVDVHGQGSATVTGLGIMSGFGTDEISNVEELHFFVDTYPEPTPEGQFVGIPLAPRHYGDGVSGSAAGDAIDLADYPGAINVDAGAGDDTITGNGADNHLIGRGGNDVIDGGDGGNDIAAFHLPNGTEGSVRIVGLGDGQYVVRLVQEDETFEDVFFVEVHGTGSATVTGLGIAAGLGVDSVTNVEDLHFSVETYPEPTPEHQFANILLAPRQYGEFVGGSVNDDFIGLDGYPGGVNADGGDGDDQVHGTEDANVLTGGSGDDRLVGSGGNDTLDGNDGDDIGSYDLPGDTIGTLRLVEGGEGNLLIQLVQEDGSFEDIFSVQVHGQGRATVTGLGRMEHLGTDEVYNVEDLHFFIDTYPEPTPPEQFVGILLAPRQFGDSVSGSAADDVIDMAAYPGSLNADGGAGNDTITGNDADNYISGNGGNDVIDGGGGGNDIADFRLPNGTEGSVRIVGLGDGQYVVRLVQEDETFEDVFFVEVHGTGSATVTGLGIAAGLGVDSVTNVEDLHFSVETYPEPTPEDQFANILLAPRQYGEFVGGSVNDDFIGLDGYPGGVNADGGDGDDNINGNEDANVLVGGSGDDRLVGHGGNDLLDGGEGDDIGSYDLPGDTIGTLRLVPDGEDLLVQLVQEDGSFEDIFHVAVHGPGNATITGLGRMEHLGTDDVYNVEDLHFFVDTYPEPTPEGQFVGILLETRQFEQYVNGSAADDVIVMADYPGATNADGGAGHDLITGSDGDDYISGRGGNDAIDGGGGNHDVAAFQLPGDTEGALRIVEAGEGAFLVQLVQEDESFEDVFLIEVHGQGNATITGLGIAAHLGIDNVNNVEDLHFIIESGLDPLPEGQVVTFALAPQHHGEFVAGSEVGDYINLPDYPGAVNTNGGGGNDHVNGTDDANDIYGGVGNDHLNGGAGDDILNGAEDDDYIVGQGGDDTIYGGDGFDSAVFHLPGDTEGTLRMVEEGGDLLVQLVQEDGSFEDVFSIHVNGPGNAMVTGLGRMEHLGTDHVYDVEDLQFFVETWPEPTPEGQFVSLSLTINQHNQYVNGTPGSDFIDMADYPGATNVDGGAGDDTIIGSDGDDYISGRSGDDSIDGGAGNHDIAAFHLPGDTEGTLRVVRGDEGDFHFLVQLVQEDGSFENVFSIQMHDQGSATITGLGLAAQVGTNNVTNVEDLHFLIESGLDPLPEGQVVTVPLAPQQHGTEIDGSETHDYIDLADYPGAVDVEGDDGDDFIVGNDEANDLEGGDGNDFLTGGGGNDEIGGGEDDDFLIGGGGDDLIDGGDGNDIAAFHLPAGTVGTLRLVEDENGDFVVQLVQEDESFQDVFRVTSTGQGSATVTGLGIMAGLGTDTVTNVEQLYLHVETYPEETPADQFIAIQLGWVQGSEGDDVIDLADYPGALHVDGGDGNDTITGSDEDNYLIGGGGSDVIDGRGGGNDIVTFHLPGETTGALHIVEDGDGDFLVQLVQEDGSSETVFSVEVHGQGSATVTGLGIAAHLGTDSVTNVEDLHFTVDTWPEPTPEEQFANILLTPRQYENYVGGSVNDDVIDLSTYPGAAYAAGGFGNDTVIGNDGDNHLSGEQGDDTIAGGGGFDTAGFHLPEGLEGSLRVVAGTGEDSGTFLVERVDGAETETVFRVLFQADGSATVEGLGSAASLGTDALSRIDQLDFTSDGGAASIRVHTGEATDDTITGANGSADVLTGGAGDDFLRGLGGNDILLGGDGNDLMRGDEGVDYFDGGADDDGEGYYSGTFGDTVTFQSLFATQGAVADLRTGVISNDGFGNVETMIGIEALGYGTAFADTFYGNDNSNWLSASVGDTLSSFGGDDYFDLSGAAALVDGGEGHDTLVLRSDGGHLLVDTNGDGVAEVAAAATSGWLVNLSLNVITDGYGNSGAIQSVESLVGSHLGDTLVGDAADNSLSGEEGNDTIAATGGADSVDGGAGTDVLTAVMSDSDRFAAATGSRTYTITAEHIGDDSGTIDTSFVNVERVVLDTTGAGDFGDTIDASGFVSTYEFAPLRLLLGNGDDVVIGSGENDFIETGLGTNTIDAGAGDDEVRAAFDNSGGGTVYVTASGDQILTTFDGVVTNSIVNAETVSVEGTDADAEVTRVDASGLSGFGGRFIFWDNNGSNISIGSAGSDIFANVHGAEAGDDVYTGNGGADIYDYTFAVGAMDGDTITDFDADDVIDLQYNDIDLNAGGLLADQFIGNAAFTGVAGQYRYFASGGQTFLEVDTSGDGVADETLTIANGEFDLAETFAGSNVLTMVVMTGTAGADSIVGTSGSDTIHALEGNDTIAATQGMDNIDGGAGFDTINAVMADSSRFSAATGSRTYTITAGHIGDDSGAIDTSFVNVERVSLRTTGTGDFGDTIDASGFVSTEEFSMRLFLGGGDDVVIGSAGSDYVLMGLGNNTADLGEGYDLVSVTLDNTNPDTIYVTGSGSSLITTQSGVQTNSITNAEEFIVQAGTDGVSVTIDVSGYVAEPGSTLYVYGHNGTDIMIGSSGNDFFANLTGQALGHDVYTGNGGADIYDYTYAADSMDNDTITDFDTDDIIDFRFNNLEEGGSPLLCNQFIGASAFSGTAGEYRYQINGTQTIIQLDSDGDAVVDQTVTISNGGFVLAETEAGSNMLTLAYTIAEVEGTVADGYLAGATLFIDTDGDQVLDDGEAWTTTDAQGDFVLNVNQAGTLVAFGGTNIDTGLANSMTLAAPTGSGMVNPLTTLVQAVIAESGGTLDAAAAEADVKAVLGIDAGIDLLNTDLIAEAAGGNAAALSAQRTAAIIVTILAAAEGVGEDDGGETEAVGQLASMISSAAGSSGSLALTDSAVIQQVLSAAAPDADVSSVTQTVAQSAQLITEAESLEELSDSQQQISDSLDEALEEYEEENESPGGGGGGGGGDDDDDEIVEPDYSSPGFVLVAPSGFEGTIGTSGRVIGTAGVQEIIVLDRPASIEFDPSFNRGGDRIRLSGDAADYSVRIVGSRIEITDGDTTLGIPVGTGVIDLVFDDGVRAVSLDVGDNEVTIGRQVVTSTFAEVRTTANAPTNLGETSPDVSGRVVLAAGGEEVTVGGNLNINGSLAEQIVHVVEGGNLVFDASFNRGGDTIILDREAGDYQAELSGSRVLLSLGDEILSIPVGPSGIILSFADGDRVLRYDLESESVLIGDDVVDGSASLLGAELAAGAKPEAAAAANGTSWDQPAGDGAYLEALDAQATGYADFGAVSIHLFA